MKVIQIITLLFVLCLTVEAQRGVGADISGSSWVSSSGSSQKASSGLSTRRSRRRMGRVFTQIIWPLLNESANRTNTNKRIYGGRQDSFYAPPNKGDSIITRNKGDWSGFGIVFIILCLGGSAYFVYSSIQKEKEEKAVIERDIDDFVKQNQSLLPVADQYDQQVRSFFQSKTWFLKFETEDGSFVEKKGSVKIKKVQKRDRWSFKFEMHIHDKVGQSVAKGVIVPDDDGKQLQMMFEKTYNNKSAAGQTGFYRFLYYKGKNGKKDRDIFKGTWAYKCGYSSNQKGTWTMFHE